VDSLQDAQHQANLCEQFLHLTTREHYTVTAAARALGRSPAFFSGQNSVLARYLRGGVAALEPQRRRAGAGPSDLTADIEALAWFIPAARFFYINSNFTEDRGSLPEAIRRTISLPALPIGWKSAMRDKFLSAVFSALSAPPREIPSCPCDIREAILARQDAGQPLVPERIARQILSAATLVHHHRSPRAWSLDTLSAPGSQRRYLNARTGLREIMQPGDWFGGDDATPGIAVCVPCREVLTPCSQKFGVLLGRFQWLAYDDARADKILAWDYVVRPRGSYRAEDVVNGIGAVTRAHGIPRKGWQLEGGTFNANLVRQCISLLGCEHWRTYSPHQKAIESIFNRVWTRLALQFPHADMGRYRNENEANCALYETCKRGHKDPRLYFPTLDLVIAAFEEEVRAHNARRIRSEQYGQWIPDELFDQAIAANPLRPFNPDMAWIFSPFSVERKVRGMLVRTRVPMFEDFSVPYEFHAEWMPLYDGKLVRLHFDPRAPRCTAKVVLAEDLNHSVHQPSTINHQPARKGDILGDAQLIGETAAHIRLVMGWANEAQAGSEQRAGYIARQRTAHFMRRETRAITGAGRVTYAKSEERDGLGTVSTIESAPSTPSIPSTGSTRSEENPVSTPSTPTGLNHSAQGCPAASGTTLGSANPANPNPVRVPSITASDRAALLREQQEFNRNHSHLID